MSDSTSPESETDAAPHETPEVVDHKPTEDEEEAPRNAISEPAKVMRIGSMIKQLLEEVRSTPMDEAGRNRLKDIYETSIEELGEALSSDLTAELNSLALPFGENDVPSDSELRIAQAQLVGWLEGLFHGIQATLFAQQMAARQQLEQMQQQQALPQGGQPPRTGTYL
ncbi:MAG: bacterial proteasome activator family protein [Acidimicrobiales bacterium]